MPLNYPVRQRNDLCLRRRRGVGGGPNHYDILLDNKHVLETVVLDQGERQKYVLLVEINQDRHFREGNMYIFPLPAASSREEEEREGHHDDNIELLDKALEEVVSRTDYRFSENPLVFIEEAVEELDLDEYITVIIPFSLGNLKKMFRFLHNLNRRLKRACPEVGLHFSTMRTMRAHWGGQDLSFVNTHYEHEHVLYVSSGAEPVSSIRIKFFKMDYSFEFSIDSNTRSDFEGMRYNQFLRIAAYLLFAHAFGRGGTMTSTVIDPISVYSIHKLFKNTSLSLPACNEIVAHTKHISVDIDEETTRRANDWLRILLRKGARGISCVAVASSSRILRSAASSSTKKNTKEKK